MSDAPAVDIVTIRRTPPPGVPEGEVSHIARDLWFLAVPVSEIVEDPRNARDHDARNRDSILASVETFKQQKPIVYQWRDTPEGRVRVARAGNGTVQAFRKAGWAYIAASEFEDESEINAMAYAIADNRTAELATWALPRLAANIEEIGKIDTSLIPKIGWAEHEVRPLLSGEFGTPPSAERRQATDDADDKKGGHPIWLSLWEHRAIVDQALVIQRQRQIAMKAPTTDGHCIAAICRDWIEAQGESVIAVTDDEYAAAFPDGKAGE